MTTPGGKPRPIDAGLANERTALASTRTALSLAASGALTIRLGVEHDLTLAGIAVGAGLLVSAAGIWFYGAAVYRRRHESWDDIAWERPVISDRRMLAATAAVTVLASLTALGFAVLTIP